MFSVYQGAGFLSVFCQALITNKEVEVMQGGGGAGCCGCILVAVDKTRGGKRELETGKE